jgi:hypothetical protein
VSATRPALRIRRTLAILLPLVVLSTLLSVVNVTAPSPGDAAQAASTAGFKAGDIISDSTFTDTSSMSTADIQSFLNAKESGCTASNGQPCLKDFRMTTATMSADNYCRAFAGASGDTAASILSKVASACGINPQVLLVMLQKEQGLVLSTAPSAFAYLHATGFFCPDTPSGCDPRYSGFQNQVYYAARQMQVYAKNPNSFGYAAGAYNTIRYSPDASCGSTSVYIENQATASLYNYTPYTPNAAALAAGYGSAPCGAYGNRNFYLYFMDWFGNPSNWFESASFEGGSVTGWNWSNGAINRLAVKNATQAQSGDYFLAANTAVSGRAVTQTVTRSTQIGEQANATIWLRSSGTAPFTGKAVLWGLGGSQEQAVTTFQVGPTWTQVNVQLPVRNSAHTQIRLDIYMTTTTSSLWLDNATLAFGTAPVLQNQLRNSSFEGSFGGWTQGNGFVNQQIYNSPTQAKVGNWFAASNTSVAGRSFAQQVPIFGDPSTGYVFSIWLRSGSSTPFQGTLALWGLGGSKSIVNLVPYSVGPTWTRISVALDPGTVAPTSLKAEVYMNTTGSTLWLDGAQLSNSILTAGTFEGGASQNWVRSGPNVNFVVYSQAQTGIAPHGGSYFAATNSSAAGGSVSQTVSKSPNVGDTYTAEVWLRSSSTTPYTGRLALWGLGGTTEAASTSFTVGQNWTKVSVIAPIAQSGHTALKFEIYDDTTSGTLFVDDARLF